MSYSENETQIIDLAENTFTARAPLLSLWQEIAENFYPERADFVVSRSMGSEFASHLMDSYPVVVRRDLGDAITSMLRPKAKEWGGMTVWGEDTIPNSARRWLDWAWQRQRQAMYMQGSQFTRATKEGDQDFACFGGCVLHVGMNRERNSMLYRNIHLRDAAWRQNDEGKIDAMFIRRKFHAIDVQRRWKNHDPKVAEMVSQGKPFSNVNLMHIVCAKELYPQLERNPHTYVSLWVDVDHKRVMEAVTSRRKQYVIPRWQTVSGSQYPFSPATIVGLPDARLIQSMAFILLQAGEKVVDPPMIATHGAVRGDVDLFASGITWVEAEYDERLGNALRPIQIDNKGLPYGLELNARAKEQLKDIFYLNQITGLPQMSKEMTAYEAAQLVENYIRRATPLFEPMEAEYNGQLCEETFDTLLWSGAFGALDDMPRELRGRQIEFKFKSPLHDALGRERASRLFEAVNVLTPMMQLDPTVRAHFDVHSALRDALQGMEVPASWVTDEERAVEAIAQMQQQAAMQQQLEAVQAAGVAAQEAGKGGQEVTRAAA